MGSLSTADRPAPIRPFSGYTVGAAAAMIFLPNVVYLWGADMAAMARFCGECGAQAVEGRKFCTGCGAPIGTSAGVPATQAVSTPRTMTREYRDDQHRRRDAENMAAHGWQVQNVTHVAGKYRGSRGCLLFLIFAPLALVAGRTPDNWIVTYVTTTASAAPPMVSVQLPPPQQNWHLLGRMLLAGVVIFVILAIVMSPH